MRKFILPSKDLSIYQAYPNNNTGLDEILEIGKTINKDAINPSYISSSVRILMDFDLPTTASVPATASYYLNLRFANANDVHRKQKLIIYKVSQSWDEGSGYFYQNVKNVRDGATWSQCKTSVESFSFVGDGTTTVFSVSSSYSIIDPLSIKVNNSQVDNTDFRVSGSNNIIFNTAPASSSTILMYALVGTLWTTAGGDYLSSGTSQSITLSTYPIEDVRVDVTDIFRPIVSQSLQNSFYGILLKFPELDEINEDNIGNVKFFSSQTHTIHVPRLEIVWDNQSFTTGSLKGIPSTNVKIATTNLKESYKKGDVSRVNLIVRDEYPQKSFDSTLRYKNKYYLPTSSFYSIVDVQSNTAIVPFDDYSKINCDSEGSHIILDTTPLFANRYYTINFQFQTGSYTRTVETGTLFKIV